MNQTLTLAEAPGTAPRQRRRIWPWMVLAMLLLPLLAAGLLVEWLQTWTPASLTVDGVHVWDSLHHDTPLTLLGATIAIAGVALALLVVMVVVPLVLTIVAIIVPLAIVLALVFGLGLPVLVVAIVIAALLSPLLILAWLIKRMVR